MFYLLKDQSHTQALFRWVRFPQECVIKPAVITGVEKSDVAMQAFCIYPGLTINMHTKAVTSRKDASARPKHITHHPQNKYLPT